MQPYEPQDLTQVPLTPQQELLLAVKRKRLVRNSLREWARTCGYEPARHHDLLIDTLEAATRREKRRILFTLPPNSAKSP